MVSGTDLFFALFNNLAIFIALTAIYAYILSYFDKAHPVKKQFVTGTLFGIFAIGCMYAKIPVYEGVIVDQRNAIVALSGLYGGVLAAFISAVMTGSYRLYLGGGGALAGFIGVCLAAFAGIILRILFKKLDTVLKAGAGGLLATIIILPGFLFVDDLQTGFRLMMSMSLPYGSAIFLGISLVGLVLNRQTEQFKIEKAFRESEKRYREVVEGTSDLVTNVDEKGRFTYVNNMSQEIFGISPAEIIGKSAFDFIPEDDQEQTKIKFQNWIDDRMASAVLENKQTNLKTGYTRSILWNVHFHYDEKGTPTGASSIGHDITARKHAEERLHIFNELINNSNDTIFVVDPTSARILDVNRKATKNLGYSEDELLKMKVFDIHVDLLADNSWEEAIGNLGKRQFLLVEGQYRKKDGSEVTMEINVTLSKYIDREYIITVARDLTKRKELENKLNQSHKMEAIGRLAGGVAHDLNNLLTPIIGYSEMISLDPHIDRNVKQKLEIITKAGEGARDLVRQLLALSRKQMLEYKSVDLNQVLEGFENLMRRTIREDIEIKIIKDSKSRPVMADVGQIEQVIMNLLVNAADAMPEGGLVTIETSLAELDENSGIQPESKTGHFMMLSVSDTGCGMDEDTQSQIFEPFFSTKGELGTGLGLATVYGIVKQHNGNIWVYSEPGQGSTFKIYLPVTEQAAVKDEAPPMDPADLNGTETILLVEDNNEVRSTAVTILEQLGYSVLIAENGTEAVEMMSTKGQTVHLLLTDVVMPGMNGKELYAALAGSYPSLKVLYMSGYTDNIIVHHGVLDNGVQLLQKPFTTYSIAAKVRETLDSL